MVFPVDISLDATPDMESRVVIRTRTGDTLASKDYSSPRGFNGYYVVNARWSPDSKFFVYSMSSSGGHSPWQFPMAVYSREKNAFAAFSDMIEGKPTTSADFKFVGPHTVVASTWKQPGAVDDTVLVPGRPRGSIRQAAADVQLESPRVGDTDAAASGPGSIAALREAVRTGREPPPAQIVARHPSYWWFVIGTVCIGAFMGQVDPASRNCCCRGSNSNSMPD